MKKIDTFSVNSLKILDRDLEKFILKYEENLLLTPSDKAAKTGQNLHNFLSYYLLNFDTTKIETSFAASDKTFVEKIKTYPEIQSLKNSKDKKIEAPFFVKCDKYFLTGRFDAVLNPSGNAQIFDWKTTSLPKNPTEDLQTVVYLYSANKLYASKALSITYVALSTGETATVNFEQSAPYETKILDVIKKYYKE